MVQDEKLVEKAAQAITEADAILVGAGAGMGVDSGLPDFRGDKGFWKAYPPFKGRKFFQISNPGLFIEDPYQAWGFFGHRLNLYRSTVPHQGFHLIRKWIESLNKSYFIYTSNVDGQFQQAGFTERKIVECHGSIHFLQCIQNCTAQIWSADSVDVVVDEEQIRAQDPLPRCLQCDDIARPNILMFGDFGWIARRSAEQERAYEEWLQEVRDLNVVAVELGAGTAIPTVRFECQRNSTTLIRINPRDFQAPDSAIALPLGALDALSQIDSLLDI